MYIKQICKERLFFDIKIFYFKYILHIGELFLHF